MKQIPCDRKLLVLSFACSFVIGSLPSLALDPDKDLTQCRLDIWTTRDGLPPHDIEAITQTPDGYLWLGTRAGVARFDGVSCKVFDTSNMPGLTRESIISLGVARTGALWLGTDGGGFGRLDADAFRRQPIENETSRWSQHKAICAARDGSLWIGGGGAKPLIHLHDGRAESPQTTMTWIQDIAEDPRGNVWFADGARLVCRAPNGHETVIASANGHAFMAVTAVRSDHDGVWVGTSNLGLCHYSNGKFHIFSMRDGLSSNEVTSLCLDRRNNLWIGTKRGVNRLHDGRFTVFGRNQGLPNANIGPIYEDREGNLWAATGGALLRFQNTRLTPVELRDTDGIVATPALCADHDKGAWLGTATGLAHLGPRGYTLRATGDGIPLQGLQSLVEDGEGCLWMVDGGAFAGKNARVIYYRNGRFGLFQQHTDYYSVGRDADGIVFAGADGKLYRYRHGRLASTLSLSGDRKYVFCFLLDKQKTLWAGTAAGLCRVEKDKLVLISAGLPPESQVLSLERDGENGLWVGTDKGLAHYAGGKFSVYTQRCGLPDDVIYQIRRDDAGQLWGGCARGIFTVRPGDLLAFDRKETRSVPCILHGSPSGIRSFPWLGQAQKTPDGRLWFLGQKGVTIVDPKNIRKNPLPPPVLIDYAQLDGRPFAPGAPVSLPPGKGELEIRYTATSLTQPDRVRFVYRLEGYDKRWIEVGARRAAFYTNLSPGTYSFRVLACNEDGVWNNAGTTLKFTLQPFYYQTFSFRAALALLASAFVCVGVKIRTGRLQQYSRKLEAKVGERTEQWRRSHAALMESRDELEATNAELVGSNEKLEAANGKLAALATTDGMTGLANHRAFQEKLHFELLQTQRTNRPLSLILLDVDHFKSYNDSYGHPAGDEALKTLGCILQESLRLYDFPARYGGEEFAIVLPGANMQEALMVAERIRQAVEEFPFPYRRVTVSIGLADCLAPPPTPEELVACADRALYQAKRNGRNCVVVAEQTPTNALDDRAERDTERLHAA